jgi:hypothetical protein
VLEGILAAESRQTFPVTLKLKNREKRPAGVQIVPFDITLDERRYGQLFDFMVMAKE